MNQIVASWKHLKMVVEARGAGAEVSSDRREGA